MSKVRSIKHVTSKKFKQMLGTPRRLFWNVCRPGYVRRNLSRRQGECQRCGACCKLVWRCAFYFEDKGLPACRLYKIYRTSNCSKFPIDQHDLNDRNRVLPEKPCGYRWDTHAQTTASRN